MRLIFRLILVWLVIFPLGIYLAMPLVLDHATGRAQEEAHRQCLSQAQAQPQAFPPSMPQIAEQYCGCVGKSITITRADLLARLRQQPTTELNDRVSKGVELCGHRLANPASGDAQVLRF